MREKTVEIATADGRMDAFVTHPEEGGPFPAVLVLMDIWGLREELFDVARRIATVGYYCVVPNFWYRRGKVRFEFRDEQRPDAVAVDASPRGAGRASRQHAPGDRPHGDGRHRCGAEVLDGEPVRPGPKGTVGYCLGGRLSLAAAAEYPDHFRASASMHGTRLVNDNAGFAASG